MLLNISIPEIPVGLATFGIPQYGRDVTCVASRHHSECLKYSSRCCGGIEQAHLSSREGLTRCFVPAKSAPAYRRPARVFPRGLLAYSSNPVGQLECQYVPASTLLSLQSPSFLLRFDSDRGVAFTFNEAKEPPRRMQSAGKCSRLCVPSEPSSGWTGRNLTLCSLLPPGRFAAGEVPDAEPAVHPSSRQGRLQVHDESSARAAVRGCCGAFLPPHQIPPPRPPPSTTPHSLVPPCSAAVRPCRLTPAC